MSEKDVRKLLDDLGRKGVLESIETVYSLSGLTGEECTRLLTEAKEKWRRKNRSERRRPER